MPPSRNTPLLVFASSSPASSRGDRVVTASPVIEVVEVIGVGRNRLHREAA